MKVLVIPDQTANRIGPDHRHLMVKKWKILKISENLMLTEKEKRIFINADFAIEPFAIYVI